MLEYVEGYPALPARALISQRRYNIRTGSAAYFLLIGFLVNFLCIVAPPVGTRSRRVRFVFFLQNELCWIDISPS